MKTHEAMKKAIQGDAIEHAKALRLNVRSVYRFCEPTTDFSDSGALNPLDRLETVIATSMAMGHPAEDAQAPLVYLAQRFNGTYLPGLAQHKSFPALTSQVCKTVARFGDMIESVGSSVHEKSESGNDISPNELREIHSSGFDVLIAVGELMRLVEQMSETGAKR